jgi:hypothetical protein
MTFFGKSRLLICVLAFLPLAGLAREPVPEPGDPSLEVIEQDRRGEFRAAKSVDWDAYTRVKLDRPTVEFREFWIRDQRQRSGITIREDDERRIKDSVADLFEKVLSRELETEGGYSVTAEPGQDVLHFTPRIVDLDIVAPDRARDYIGTALADSQGRMTIELEIRDSLSGRLLATSRQNEEDPYKGYMEWTNSATNHRAARLMLLRWSNDLLEQLEELRATRPD